MFDDITALVAPHQCVGCSAEETIICDQCARGLTPAISRCYRCHKLSEDWRTCPSCRRESKLFAAIAYTEYDGAGETLVRKLKYGHAVAAAKTIAALLSPCLPTGKT